MIGSRIFARGISATIAGMGMMLLAACAQLPLPSANRAEVQPGIVMTPATESTADTPSPEASATALATEAIVTEATAPSIAAAAVPATALEPITPTVTAAANPAEPPAASRVQGMANAALVLPTATPQAAQFTLPTPTPDVTTPTAMSADATTPTVTLAPTEATASVPISAATLTPSLPSVPMAFVTTNLNVRSGPGTNYSVIAGLSADSRVPIVGRNANSEWWQVELQSGSTGWLYASLVTVEGASAEVALVTDIPTPPPTATPLTAATEAPAATAAAESPAAPAADASAPVGTTHFRVVSKRLWDVYENGGSLFGDSVTCGEKRQLVVIVLDAQGNRLNGVAVQADYGAREIFVTGGQGKGDGQVEFVLGAGQDVRIIRDADGSEVTSEVATGLTTNPAAIAFDQLIAAQYCTDSARCQHFVDAPGCFGHFSWTAIFQRDR